MAHQSKYPSLDRQWHKMMFSFFEYLPMQYRQATEREWQIYGVLRMEKLI